MVGAAAFHVPIRFDRWSSAMMSALFVRPRRCEVVVGEDVEIRMGWAFRARFPRSAVVATAPAGRRPLSRGVHGFGGRWLVNGSGDGLLEIRLDPVQRGYVIGVPVRLRRVTVSVDDPSRLASMLSDGINA